MKQSKSKPRKSSTFFSDVLNLAGGLVLLLFLLSSLLLLLLLLLVILVVVVFVGDDKSILDTFTFTILLTLRRGLASKNNSQE